MRLKKIQLYVYIMVLIIVLTACSQTPAAIDTVKTVEPSKVEQQKDKDSVIMGQWIISKRLQTQNVSAVSEEEFEKNYLNKKVEYTSTSAQFGEDTLQKPSYESKEMSAEQFEQGYRGATFKQLGIDADSAMVIEVTKEKEQWLSPGGIIFVKNEEVLISYWDGVFFEMTRAK